MQKLRESQLVYEIPGSDMVKDVEEVLRTGNVLKDARDAVNTVHGKNVECRVFLTVDKFRAAFLERQPDSSQYSIRQYIEKAGMDWYPDANFDVSPIKEALEMDGRTLKRRFRIGRYHIVDLK